MSLDFAVFDLTELAVLDATDAVALPEMGASSAGFTEDIDDLISGGVDVGNSYCCSSSTCCCC